MTASKNRRAPHDLERLRARVQDRVRQIHDNRGRKALTIAVKRWKLSRWSARRSVRMTKIYEARRCMGFIPEGAGPVNPLGREICDLVCLGFPARCRQTPARGRGQRLDRRSTRVAGVAL